MGADYTKPLAEWIVTVTMKRCPDREGPTRERAFTFTIPAVDAEHAQRGAVDIGLGINEASGHQWRLAGDDCTQVCLAGVTP